MDVALGVIVSLLIVGALLKLALFVAKDAKSRGRNGLGWGVFVFFIPLLGAPLYFLYVRESQERGAEEFGLSQGPGTSQVPGMSQGSRSLTQNPKLGFLGWCFAGGVTFGKVPGSGFGSVGAALLFAGAVQFFGAAGSDTRPEVQALLVALGILTGLVAVALLAWGYSAYSAAYDEERKRLEPMGKN